MTIHLTLFGRFHAHNNGVTLTGFRSDKTRALFAFLAVEAERPHRRETLATYFWPEMSDALAKRSLRQALYRLKQAIPLADDWLEVTRQTVMLRRGWVTTDVVQFQCLVDTIEAQPINSLHTNESALRQLAAAADLYQGAFLQTLCIEDALSFTEWQAIQRERYQHQALATLQLLANAYLHRKQYAKAQACAERQLELEPWQEVAYQQAMQALALQGQRELALAQFERCQTVLWKELGIAVSAETQSLHMQLLAGNLNPFRAESRNRLNHFPAQFTPFIGRQAAIDHIVEQLEPPNSQLLTIVAVGGMGKTRLSIEAANVIAQQPQRFPDGLYFVTLARLGDPDLLATAIGSQLGIKFAVSSTPKEQLLAYLHSRSCLLVLDNFEHIMAAKQLVAEIIQAAPAVKLLVTSRQALNLYAEHRLSLEGLIEAEALQLFAQAARRGQPRFVISAENRPALQQIVQLTQGMPLALEMAASWTRLLSCEQIAKQIATHNAAFLEERPDLLARHRSVQAVFDHSWALLNLAERRALAQLAIFRAGMTLDAILAVTDASLTEIASLLDKSLIKKQAERFAHHPLLRQLAAKKLAEDSTQKRLVERQYADFYTHFLASHFADIQLRKPTTLRLISAELGNIEKAWRIAIRDSQVDNITRSYRPLAAFYEITHRYSEWRSTFHFAVIQFDARPDTLSSKHPLMVAGILSRYAAALQNEAAFGAAFEAAQRSLAIAQQHGLAEIIPQTMLAIGRIQYFQGELHSAETTLRQAAAESKKMGMQFEQTDALECLATALLSLGAADEAKVIFREAQALSAEIGDWHVLMLVTSALGFIASIEGDYDMAWHYWDQVLTFDELEDNRLLVGRVHNYISLQYITRGEFALAREAAERGQAALRNLTFTRVYFDLQCASALIAGFQGDFDYAWEIEAELQRVAVNFVASAATRNQRARTVRGVLTVLSGKTGEGVALLKTIQADPATGWENKQLIDHFFTMVGLRT